MKYQRPVIGVVGNGVVGNATAWLWMEHAEVRVYDTVDERRTHPLPEVLKSDLIMVCLPTPRVDPGSGLDVKALVQFFTLVAQPSHSPLPQCYVIRSTVPIGFTERMVKLWPEFDIIHWPEFLTSRCAVVDAQTPARNVLGVPNHRMPSAKSVCSSLTIHLLLRRFPGVPLHTMSSSASEMVKLATNGFFSVKLAYFNEVQAYCASHGIDWHDVLGGVLADGRIAHAHTRVPGPDGRFGFGGECLPKDLEELVQCLGEYGMVCNAAARRNEAVDRRRVR